jgi:hypothetical protein
MQKQTKILFSALFLLVLTLNLASAMIVKSVDSANFQPGSEQDITLRIKNTLTVDATDVSVTLDLTNLPFSIIKIDDNPSEISQDDTEKFDFRIKATSDAKAGDYPIPYTINYNTNATAKGTFILTIEAEPQLVYSASVDTPVVGSKTKVTLKIVNKGLGDAKFVTVTILPSKYTLLSDDNSYIGTVSSDDSQTENFDIIFTQPNPTLVAQIEYRKFNNELVTETINLPLVVYSQKEALTLGIIPQNNTAVYVIVSVLGIVGWMIVRRVRKKKRLNKAQGR